MNVLQLLKSKAGKLTVGIPQLAAIAGVGLIGVYSALQADKAQMEQKVRSLSSISNAYDYSGLRQSGRGGLTSINVKDGLNQLATAEERARIEAARTGGGDFGLGAADNVGNAVSGALGGAGYQMSGSEGFGMGANAATEISATPSGRAADVNVNRASVANGAAAGRAQAGNQLASASMARASGSGMSGSYGGASSGTSGGSSASAGGAGRYGASGSGEGYKFSGSMPSGTNPVSLSGADGRNSSSFGAGGRNASVGRGSRSRGAGNDLKDISKRSADAAANRHRASNEGSRAFLASSQNSSGMSFDSGVETMETGSADFATLEAANVKKAREWGAKTKDFSQKRSDAADRLRKLMLATIFGGFAAIAVGSWLLTKPSIGAKVAGYGVLGLFALMVAVDVIPAAWKFYEEFDKPLGNIPYQTIMVDTIAGIFLGGALLAAVKPRQVHTVLKTILDKILGGVKGLIQSAVSTIVLPMVKTIFGDLWNKNVHSGKK